MNLTHETAHELAGRLIAIHDCPRADIFIDAMAANLMRWCRSFEEAELMVQDAVEQWTEWLGPVGLLCILRSLRPEQSKPVVQLSICDKCGESGTVEVSGRYEWCTCLAAKTIRAAEPHRLEEMNRPPTEAELAPVKPHEIRLLGRTRAIEPRRRQHVAPIARELTQEQLEAAFEDRQRAIQADTAQARQTLADPDTTPNRREMAWFVLNSYSAREAS